MRWGEPASQPAPGSHQEPIWGPPEAVFAVFCKVFAVFCSVLLLLCCHWRAGRGCVGWLGWLWEAVEILWKSVEIWWAGAPSGEPQKAVFAVFCKLFAGFCSVLQGFWQFLQVLLNRLLQNSLPETLFGASFPRLQQQPACSVQPCNPDFSTPESPCFGGKNPSVTPKHRFYTTLIFCSIFKN